MTLQRLLGIFVSMAALTLAPRVQAEVLNFGLTADEIRKACKSEQDLLLKTIDAIATSPKNTSRTGNALFELELASTEFTNKLNPAIFLKYVSTNEEVRGAADECETAVQQLFVDIFVREDLYKALKAVADSGQISDAIDKKLMDEYLLNFKRNGLELPLDQRKVFIEKKKRLVALESEYAKNLVDWQAALEVTLEELAGMPQSYIDNLEKTPEGKFKVTLAYPHYFPFMENAKNASVRKRLEFLYQQKGGTQNKELLEEAIRLRDELAGLLGHDTHADFVLEKQMAKKKEEVFKFLNSLKDRLIPKGKENLAELLEAKREETGDPTQSEVYSHDWRYYENYLKRTKYQVDNQAIKEYFPLEVVLKGMFEIYQTLLGVQFVLDTSTPPWHPSVLFYRVEEKGRTIAYFFMDLFPRDGKYGHAAAFTLLSGFLKGNGSYQTPVSSIVANFNPPAPGKPSMLEHSEVETLFHEFGHIMHQVLTTAKYATFSGTSVKRDYVEAPSQMLENWVWEKEALAKMSGHYLDTSKPLPDDLIQKMVKAKLLNVGIRYLRQLSFGLIDMAYHTQASVDSTAIYHQMAKEVMLIPLQEGAMPQANFGHLMGGYDAGYYGYLWSEVFAQDMFTRFSTEGLLNPKTGLDYRKWILEPGGEIDPFALVTGFLGREPNNEAFLKSIGQ